MALLGAFGWGLIAVGALTHTAHHRRLRELLAMHVDRERLAAAALVAIEATVALMVMVAYLLGSPSLRLFAALAGALGIGFSFWVGRLLTTKSPLPCACSFSQGPTSSWSLLRAASITTAFAFIFTDAAGASVAERVTALVAGLVAATALYVVPEALSWPETSRAQLARMDSHAPTGA